MATLRKANGYTQQDVAEKLNISDRTLSSWETGRTAPDLLLLPAIADLYGVTVDEILRGERIQAETQSAEISEEAYRSMRKRSFAKFNGKRLILTGFSLLGALLFLTGCACLLYSSSPLWLNIILMVLGAGGNIACIILLYCFEYSALKSERIILEEDYTEDNKQYALTLKHKLVNSLQLNSLPYILGAIVFLIVFFACGYYDRYIQFGESYIKLDYTTPTMVLVGLNALFGLALFIASRATVFSYINKLCSEEQRGTFTHNGTLLVKTVGFGAIPVVISLVLLAVFMSINVDNTKIIYANRDKTEFKNHLQTFVVEEDFTCSAPVGEYVLTFPETTDNGKKYDLGYGFTGEYYLIHTYTDLYYYEWDIAPPHEGTPYNVRHGNMMYIPDPDSDEPETVVNVRYYHDEGLVEENNSYNDLYKTNYTIWYYNDSKEFALVEIRSYRLGKYFGIGAAVVSGITLTVCTVIFIKKRKKIKYGF